MPQTPAEFARNLLLTLALPADSIGMVRHLRAPKLTELTRRYSYKLNNFDVFKAALEEQPQIIVKEREYFKNGEICHDRDSHRDKSSEELLEEAINGNLNQPKAVFTSSNILVSSAEGRTNREMELIWFNELYTEGVLYGKLVVRMYVSKLKI